MSRMVAVGCVRSCGVTTILSALAAVWPADRQLLVAEADPAGGDLAARYGLPPEPGLVSLAAAARRSADPQLVWAHVHHLTEQVALLPAPVGAGQARAALDLLDPWLRRLGDLDADVLVDCGRLHPASTSPLWDAAPVRLLATRPQLVDLHHAADWLTTPGLAQRPTGLLLVGSAGYPAAEITDALGVAVVGELPDDPDAVAALPAGPSRRLHRSALLRHARTLATRLTESLPGAPAVTVGDHAVPSAADDRVAAHDAIAVSAVPAVEVAAL